MNNARIVRVIPQNIAETQTVTQKLRVCAYARVSTQNEEQEDSYERQINHYTSLINANENWQMVGVYADQGLTGTRAEKRPQFMQMIADCENGKIDRILVKSVSRFARNTVDAISIIRKLKDKGIAVFFESENIDTLTPGGEMLLTILAGLAEQESRNISTNIKWAMQKKFKNGEVTIVNLYGYKKADNGNGYEIVEEEGEIVRRIFREYLCGYSVNQIVDGLKRDNISTKRNGANWQRSTIMRMLENIKYKGDAILGKTYKPDVLSPKRIKNDGKMPMYYVENSHPAIIDKELFDLVQEEIKIRKKADYATKTGEGKYVSKYPFSGMIICGDCMSRYRRLIRKKPNGEEIPTWVCTHRIASHDGKCESVTLKESDVEKTYLSALKELAVNMLNKNQITNIIERAIVTDLTAKTDTIEEEIITLQQQAIVLHTARKNSEITDDVYKNQIEILSKELREKESEQVEIKTLNAEKILTESRKSKILEISKQTTLLETFDTALMKSLLHRIVVINKTTLKLEFKGGESVVREI
ncbi:MAG: recombinase family protein [Bacillota bacterium]